jgi:sugar phosphate isomerase/epimerase
MRLSLASWSLSACSLEETAGIARALGIAALDVGCVARPAIDKEHFLRAPESYGAAMASRCGIPLGTLFYLFGKNRPDRNLADPTCHQLNLADFDKVLSFCREASIRTIFVLPGVINPGQTRSEAVHSSAEIMRRMVNRAQNAGIDLCFEAHAQSIVESPDSTLQFLADVPGLKLALDPSHYVVAGWPQSALEPLIAHAGCVHLRQAAPGRLQKRLDDGTINFPDLFGALSETGYAGDLTLEFVHAHTLSSYNVDVMTETVRMRDLFDSWVAARC